MVNENHTVWTLFAFGKRSKTWGMIGLDDKYKSMSTTVLDNDAGWWKTARKGKSIHEHLPLKGYVGVTVDSIIIDNDSRILLIKRGKEPYKNMWALPGGRVEPSDNDIESACYRELKEETNISDVKLKYATFVGNPHRDPRGFCVSFVFIGRIKHANVKAGDDAVSCKWFPLTNLPNMAFDHQQIVEQCIGKKDEMERTLFLIKPDGVQRNLYKDIIKIIERKLTIVDEYTQTAPIEICNLHYIEHKNKDYYNELCTFISSGPIIIILAEGHEAVCSGRIILESIRSKYILSETIMQNIIHASDSQESAQREIALWFGHKKKLKL
jgi:8-oxo-dGTP diphosphatase